MSIILKGIDLDEITAGNGYARLEIEEDGTVVDDISDIIIGYAIQIPAPHGRLIDADKLKMECYHTMEELVESTTMDISAEALSLLCGFTMIGEAPTLLESEE